MKALFSRFLRLTLLWLILAAPLAAQTLPGVFSAISNARPLGPDQAFQLTTTREPGGTLDVRIDIAPGYHLYRDRLSARTAEGKPLVVQSPPGVFENDPNFGRVEIWRQPVSAKVLSDGGKVVLGWQGCADAGICYPPQSRVIPAVSPAAPAAGESASAGPTDLPGALSPKDGLVSGLLSKGGAGLVVLAFFGFGLLLAFTPCVLPMLPVVAGMLALRGTRLTPGRGAALTGSYVLAASLAFSVLGLVAALSGRNLQIALQSPAVIWAVTALFAVLAFGSFGFFDLTLPQAITRRLAGSAPGRGTLPGAFALGFTSALVIGPCVTAPLAGALLYIAQTGDALLGAAALFALGLGQGVPLMALGIFGSAALPRLGPWMARVREVFGFVFLGMAVWMAGRVLPPSVELGLWAVLLIVVGVFLGALDRLPSRASAAHRLSAAAGVIALLAGGLEAIGAASGAASFWQPLAGMGGPAPAAAQQAATPIASPAELDSALAATRGPVLVDITAGWCTSCQDIARNLLPRPDVRAALQQVTVLEVDLTHFGSGAQALLDRLGAVGPPTFIFLNAAHKEVPGTRLVGDFSAAQLVASLNRAAQ